MDVCDRKADSQTERARLNGHHKKGRNQDGVAWWYENKTPGINTHRSMNIIESEDFVMEHEGVITLEEFSRFSAAKPTVDVQWHSRYSVITLHGSVLNAIFLSMDLPMLWRTDS